MVESTSSRTLHNKCALRRVASGVEGLSHHFATPRSSLSGTQYLRHAASSFLTVFGLSPRRLKRCQAAVELLVHVCWGGVNVALDKLRQVLVRARWRRECGCNTVRER
eukprot:6190674-Pleurochrysis_carterae.AAC.2